MHPNTHLQAVIFDVDGTLIDSVDFHAEAWRQTLGRYGHEVPFEDVRFQIGKGADTFMPVFFSSEEMDRIGEEAKEFRKELFKREFLPQVRAFPCVRELFERILADGKRIALASSAVGEELEKYKEITNVGDLLQAETSADDAERSKPHPDIFQAALEGLGLKDPSRAIVIGDTPYDAEAARKAGIPSIGVLSGGFPEESLREAGCVAIFRGPADLLERYDESPLK